MPVYEVQATQTAKSEEEEEEEAKHTAKSAKYKAIVACMHETYTKHTFCENGVG